MFVLRFGPRQLLVFLKVAAAAVLVVTMVALLGTAFEL